MIHMNKFVSLLLSFLFLAPFSRGFSHSTNSSTHFSTSSSNLYQFQQIAFEGNTGGGKKKKKKQLVKKRENKKNDKEDRPGLFGKKTGTKGNNPSKKEATKKGASKGKGHQKNRNFLGIKQKPKKRFVAVGPVFGGPHGFGGRLLIRPIKQLGLAGDVSYNKIRLDEGQAIGVVATKADARLYAPNWLGDLFRLYAFAGGTMQSGKFNRETTSTVIQGDIGVGAGLKFWRVSINGEVGVLIPVKREANFNPGVGVFGNVALLIWLF